MTSGVIFGASDVIAQKVPGIHLITATDALTTLVWDVAHLDPFFPCSQVEATSDKQKPLDVERTLTSVAIGGGYFGPAAHFVRIPANRSPSLLP